VVVIGQRHALPGMPCDVMEHETGSCPRRLHRLDRPHDVLQDADSTRAARSPSIGAQAHDSVPVRGLLVSAQPRRHGGHALSNSANPHPRHQHAPHRRRRTLLRYRHRRPRNHTRKNQTNNRFCTTRRPNLSRGSGEVETHRRRGRRATGPLAADLSSSDNRLQTSTTTCPPLAPVSSFTVSQRTQS